MENLISTWLDVVSVVPQYFDLKSGILQNISKGRILKAILSAESIIRNSLRPYYGDNLSIGVARFNTECLLSNKNPDFLLKTSGITILEHFTQVYKFVFIQGTANVIATTKYTCYPDSGDSIEGDTTAELTLPYLKIGTSCWGNEQFNQGDVVYLSVYHYEEGLVLLSSKLAAAYVLDQTANSQLASDGPSSVNLKAEVNKEIEKICDPFSESLLIKQKYQDENPVSVEYNIDEHGNDKTDYIED